jgi:hypothetical protein
MTPHRPHPYWHAALAGLFVGIFAGVAAYAVFRSFGMPTNLYLLGAIVLACIPGSITLSLILAGDSLEARD